MKEIFLLGLLVIAGCTSTIEIGCNTDSDCVPKPECHPRECVTLEEANLYDGPEVCTTLFDCKAAYNQEDCLCKNNKCVNKNLENKCD